MAVARVRVLKGGRVDRVRALQTLCLFYFLRFRAAQASGCSWLITLRDTLSTLAFQSGVRGTCPQFKFPSVTSLYQ